MVREGACIARADISWWQCKNPVLIPGPVVIAFVCVTGLEIVSFCDMSVSPDRGAGLLIDVSISIECACAASGGCNMLKIA